MKRADKIKVINAHGGHGEAIVTANKRSGLHDLAWACALVEQESAFRNTFGGDYGPSYKGKPPFYEEAVTHKKVEALLKQPLNNGVGLTQLTDRGLVLEAQKLGGAHKPLNQCIVGFRYLHQLIEAYGDGGVWHYNGSPAYQSQIAAKHAAWKGRL